MEDYPGLYSKAPQAGMILRTLIYVLGVTTNHVSYTKVYTNLFPSRHTWYLLGTIVILNGIDWAAFEILSIGNNEIESLPTGYRVLDGLFQALGSRMLFLVSASSLLESLTDSYPQRCALEDSTL